MNRRLEKFTVGGCALSPLILVLYFGIAWIVNFIKFLNCDFASPWRDEIIHGIGVFFIIPSGITAWF